MVDIFGGKDIAGKVLVGEMDLTKSQIKELSRCFHVSPEVFFAALYDGTDFSVIVQRWRSARKAEES